MQKEGGREAGAGGGRERRKGMNLSSQLCSMLLCTPLQLPADWSSETDDFMLWTHILQSDRCKRPPCIYRGPHSGACRLHEWRGGSVEYRTGQLSVSASQLLPGGNVGSVFPSLVFHEKPELRILMLNIGNNSGNLGEPVNAKEDGLNLARGFPVSSLCPRPVCLLQNTVEDTLHYVQHLFRLRLISEREGEVLDKLDKLVRLLSSDIAFWELRIKIRSQLQQLSLVQFSGIIIFSIPKCLIVSSSCNDLTVLLLYSAI